MESLKLTTIVPTDAEIIQRAKWFYDVAHEAMNSDSPVPQTRLLKQIGSADFHELDLNRNREILDASPVLKTYHDYLGDATRHDVGRTTNTTAKHQAWNFIDYMPLEFSEKF